VLELVLAAERDAREFAAADASHGKYVDALNRLAEVREIHARRLEELLVRPRDAEPSPPVAAPEEPVTCPPVDEVRTRMRSDAAQATSVALDAEGIRAELAGAVSAACVAAVEVLLP
jgi:hypothetical protein